ncbi:MAG TPA: hypothetical protein VM534_02620 [Thermoanaerobaculia bacterium]|nr:hypothetical protein [Thermoanaerobaculia bacterium]
MRSIRGFVLFGLIILFQTACFEIEQALDLNRDLSGEAEFSIGIDFEPMVLIMLQMQREMEGKEGPPSAEEIAAARQEFLEDPTRTEQEEILPVAEREEMESSFPAGVRLLDARVRQSEMKVATSFRFSFDHISKLSQIELPEKADASPESKTLIKQPFAGLEFEEEGDVLSIRSQPADPTAAVEEETADAPAEGMEELGEMMKKAFEGMRVVYRIRTPFEPSEHNATRREGDLLIWEYDFAALEKLGKEQASDLGVSARYRR